MKLRLSLRLRTLIFITVLMAVSVGTSISAMNWIARNILFEQVDNDIKLLARVLAGSLSMSGQLPQQVDAVINQGMKATALVLSHYVATAEKAHQSPEAIRQGLQQILDKSMVAEIWITDSQGRAYLNAPASTPFRFNPDPKIQPQASAFWPLLNGQASVITQPMQQREIDGQLYKYVGVSGVDKPRIVQVGVKGKDIQNLINEISFLPSLYSIFRIFFINNLKSKTKQVLWSNFILCYENDWVSADQTGSLADHSIWL